MSLSPLQLQMQQAITQGAVPPDLSGNARGLAVYRTAWRARLIEALRANYPVLHRVLGDDAFAALADRYMQAHPSQRRSIRWFGEYLPAYVAAHADALPHPAVADLVRFEWAICLSFDAADHVPLSFEALSTTPADQWPELCFGLQPGVALVSLSWAVAPVWHALVDADDDGPALPPPEAHDHTVLVWRRGLQPMWRTVDPLEARLLRAVEAGDCFARLCEHAVDQLGDDAAPMVLTHLRQWVADEVLAA